jgi:hypothetical protein
MNNIFRLYAFPGALLLSLAAAGTAKPDGDNDVSFIISAIVTLIICIL